MLGIKIKKWSFFLHFLFHFHFHFLFLSLPFFDTKPKHSKRRDARPRRAYLLRVPPPSPGGGAHRGHRRPRRRGLHLRRQAENREGARREFLFFFLFFFFFRDLFFFSVFLFLSSSRRGHRRDAPAPLRPQRRRYRQGLPRGPLGRRIERNSGGALCARLAPTLPSLAPRGQAFTSPAASSGGGGAQGRGAGGGEGPGEGGGGGEGKGEEEKKNEFFVFFVRSRGSYLVYSFFFSLPSFPSFFLFLFLPTPHSPLRSEKKNRARSLGSRTSRSPGARCRSRLRPRGRRRGGRRSRLRE